MKDEEKDEGCVPSLATMKTGVLGKLHLHFSHDGRTKLHVTAQHPPLRVIRAFEHQDDVALVHLHNVSGGVLGGDQFEIAVKLDANAHAMLTTTGANRIYRHRAGYETAAQTMQIMLAENSIFEYIPDTTIPFAQSRYQQTTHITLRPGARLFWSELLAPGREAADERFAWAQYGNDVTIVANGRPILRERWQIDPAVQPVPSLAYMGDWMHTATFVVCVCGMSAADLHTLETALTTIAHRLSDGRTVWGVSRLVQDGVIVRGLSKVGRTLPSQIEQFHSEARQAIIGKTLVLPRKIY